MFCSGLILPCFGGYHTLLFPHDFWILHAIESINQSINQWVYFSGLIDYNFVCFREALQEVFGIRARASMIRERNQNSLSFNGSAAKEWDGRV